MKKLGIIGGLGPMASAYYLEKITEMTNASTDQEHIEVLLHSCPGIPDRTGYILGDIEESPLPAMVEVGNGLINAGAEVIAIPCITAQYFYAELLEKLNVYIIDGIEETARYLKDRGIKRAGLMATNGTLKCGLFQKSLNDMRIECILPETDKQDMVMDIIYNQVKAGNELDYKEFEEIVTHLKSGGSQVVILGCTELSVLKRNHEMPSGIIDVLDVMARSAVLKCGRLKGEFEELITE